MARLVEIRSLKPFKGPRSRKVMPGEEVLCQENFAACKVRARQAEYTAGGPPPTIPRRVSGVPRRSGGMLVAPVNPDKRPVPKPKRPIGPDETKVIEPEEQKGQGHWGPDDKPVETAPGGPTDNKASHGQNDGNDAKGKLLDALDAAGVDGYDRRFSVQKLQEALEEAAGGNG